MTYFDTVTSAFIDQKEFLNFQLLLFLITPTLFSKKLESSMKCK